MVAIVVVDMRRAGRADSTEVVGRLLVDGSGLGRLIIVVVRGVNYSSYSSGDFTL